ncbi:hypothetical protein SOVF_113830 [Spinacia oleracea]|uniref:Uncharacterized protein n=1 Tax=Spinacia oleracea TaxID=3562 RepID=A0A9R0JZ18_SPIOL|nr:uncharacterized protein LOC110791937 [Spinacia oleracea]KNA13712.1 hypothetical protein SOVF_113830 [Spinacia oleracea]
MKSALSRTGSIPVQTLNRTPSLNGSIPSSPKVSFRCENSGFTKIRLSNSDTDLIRSELRSSRVTRVGSVSFPDLGMIVEEELAGGIGIGIGTGNGKGKGNNYGGKGKGGSNNKNNSNEKGNIGDYYQKMLKSNPGDSLLLRNYGKYLHEVEKNVEKAEECYGRAILANPGDGELLSLYGSLIWETSKDEDRAQLYYDQALHASPNDSTVLGSYAHFLWEAEDDEEDADIMKLGNDVVLPAMVGAH